MQDALNPAPYQSRKKARLHPYPYGVHVACTVLHALTDYAAAILTIHQHDLALIGATEWKIVISMLFLLYFRVDYSRELAREARYEFARCLAAGETSIPLAAAALLIAAEDDAIGESTTYCCCCCSHLHIGGKVCKLLPTSIMACRACIAILTNLLVLFVFCALQHHLLLSGFR